MFPYHRITLPSEGKAYPAWSALYKSNGQLLINGLLTRHEDQILETGHNPTTLIEIAKELIVDEEIKSQIYNISLFDFTSLLLAIRIYAYGQEIELISHCNSCDFNTSIKYNLLANFNNYPFTANEFSCEVSSKLKLTFRQPTVMDYANGFNSTFTQMAKTLLLKVNDCPRESVDFIDNLLAKDCKLIKDAYKTNMYGYDLSGESVCGHCGEAAKLSLSNFTKSLFIFDPAYKKALHSEVFQLAYASKGGFQFSDIYNMPCNLRKSYLELLVKQKEDEVKSMETANKNA